MTNIAEGVQASPDESNEHLSELRRRRAELLESIRSLEQALAAPVPGRQMAWVERVSASLLALSSDFRDHVELTEGVSGLYNRVIRSSPRLTHAVDWLTTDHKAVTELVGELLSMVGKAAEAFARGDSILEDLDDVRERGTTLLAALVRHRQRGADLVYEGYSVDIGGQD
ncbi:MAG: hypothetical protein ABI934_06010 [Actinomycetota bacterium]